MIRGAIGIAHKCVPSATFAFMLVFRNFAFNLNGARQKATGTIEA